MYNFPFVSIRATCTAHHILLGYNTWIIVIRECQSCSSLFCIFLRPPVTSSHLGRTNFLGTLLSHILILFSPLMWDSKLRTRTKPQAKLRFCICSCLYSYTLNGRKTISGRMVGSRQFANGICPWFLHVYGFGLLGSFQNIWNIATFCNILAVSML